MTDANLPTDLPKTPDWVERSDYAPIVFLKSNFAPIDRECDIDELAIEGSLPEGLEGTFYRIGPNQRFAPAPDYHWFEADGMIHAFDIAGGKVSYRNRWMQTRKFKAESEAGRSLFGGFGSANRVDPLAADIPFNVNNTSIIHHHGRLYAMEEGSPPFAFEHRSLESLGTETFGGVLPGPMSAHCRIDGRNGELIVYGYAASGRGSPDVSWGVIAPGGKVMRTGMVTGPYCGFMHDFVITENYIVLPFFPATQSVEREQAGLPYTAWEAGLGSHYAVLRRDGTGDVRWFRADDAFAYHVMNGFEADGRIVFDLVLANHIGNFPNADGSMPDPANKVSRLTRVTLDLNGDGDTPHFQPLDDIYVDFVMPDPRFSGHPYQVGFAGGVIDPAEQAIGWNSVVRYDMRDFSRVGYSFGSGTASWEPLFVPRSKDAPEGDGWLLTMVYRAATNSSELAILDSADVAAGPVTRIHVPHRVPFGFHGAFVPAE